jgi:two-component system, NtrC family, sensor histidine kinase HydH
LTRRSTGFARWGLLATALATAVALVLTGTAGYLGARRNADAIARATARTMLFALKRELRRSDAVTGELLEAAIGDFEKQGLTYVAVVDRRGSVTASAGEPRIDPGRLLPKRFLGKPSVARMDEPGTARAVAGMRGARRRGDRRRVRDPAEWRGGPPGASERGSWIAVEVEPLAARAVLSRALATLATELTAALLLAIATAVFWRLSRRADRAEAALARDAQLKALGQMSAVLGHELRNPLASLKGHAQLLLEKLPEDHPGRRGTETVVREARRLEELSGQVLDFARSGEIDPGPTDPAALARRAVESAAAGPVDLEIEPGLDSWTLDADWMERVLVNLLVNARQAEPDEPLTLSVRRREDELLIAVRDRGPGIDPDDAERIFEPFYTRRTRGTGLGLALARRIVERHGGRISASNRPERGAEIEISLPARPAGGSAGGEENASEEV